MTAAVEAESRARYQSMCTQCDRLVGVTRDTFNRTARDPIWKLHRHTVKRGTRLRCNGSGNSVHPNTVMETR